MVVSHFVSLLFCFSFGRDADGVCAMEAGMAGCLVMNAEEEKKNKSGHNVWFVTGG